MNKRPTVSKDYSRYGKLEKGNEFHEKMARKIPYVLDQSTWNPASVNEALVDNWEAKGIIVAPQDVVQEIIDNPDGGEDWLETTYDVARAFGVPLYDTDRNVIWSPE